MWASTPYGAAPTAPYAPLPEPGAYGGAYSPHHSAPEHAHVQREADSADGGYQGYTPGHHHASAYGPSGSLTGAGGGAQAPSTAPAASLPPSYVPIIVGHDGQAYIHVSQLQALGAAAGVDGAPEYARVQGPGLGPIPGGEGGGGSLGYADPHHSPGSPEGFRGRELTPAPRAYQPGASHGAALLPSPPPSGVSNPPPSPGFSNPPFPPGFSTSAPPRGYRSGGTTFGMAHWEAPTSRVLRRRRQPAARA